MIKMRSITKVHLQAGKAENPCHIIEPKSKYLRTKDSRYNICSNIKVQKHMGAEGRELYKYWNPRA